MNTAAAITINPMFVRHDLMIEMARLEMQIDDIRDHASEHQPGQELPPLQQRLQKISHVLSRVPL